MKQILTKIKNGEMLNSDEIEKIVFSNLIKIDEILLGTIVNCMEDLKTVIEIENKYYAFYWERSLIDVRDNKYPSQELKEVMPFEELIPVITWREL